MYFRPHGQHFVKIEAPLPVERRGRLREDVTRLTQDLARRFEELVRMAPEQWHVMQPNWPSDAQNAAENGAPNTDFEEPPSGVSTAAAPGS